MSRQDDYRFLSAALSLSTFSVAELAQYAETPLDTAKTWFRRERQRAERGGRPCRFEAAPLDGEQTEPRPGPKARRWKLTEYAASEIKRDLRKLYGEAANERLGGQAGTPSEVFALPDLDAAEKMISEAQSLAISANEETINVRIGTRLQLAIEEARDLIEAGIEIPVLLAQRLGRAYVQGGLIPSPDQAQSLDPWRMWIADSLARLARANVPPRLAAPILHGIFLSGKPAQQRVQQLWFPLAALGTFGAATNSGATISDQKIVPYAFTLVEYVCSSWKLLDILLHLLRQTPTQKEIDPIVYGLPRHPLLKNDPASGLWLHWLTVTSHWREAYEGVARNLLLNAPGCNKTSLERTLEEASLRTANRYHSDVSLGQLISRFNATTKVLHDG
jgi:hypothetical protein